MATWSVGGWRNICTQRGLIEPINNVWRVTEIMGREKSQEKDWVFWGSIVKRAGFFLIYVLEEIRFSSLPQESEIEPTNIIVELGITTKLIIYHILCFTFISLFNHHTNPVGKLRHREMKWFAETASDPVGINSMCKHFLLLQARHLRLRPSLFDELPGGVGFRVGCAFTQCPSSLVLMKDRWHQVLWFHPMSAHC